MKPARIGFCCAALLTSTSAFAFDGWRLGNATTLNGKGAGWDDEANRVKTFECRINSATLRLNVRNFFPN